MGDNALVKNFSVKFSSAISMMDQGAAFTMIKQLSNFLEETGQLEQNYATFDDLYVQAERAQEALIAEMERIAAEVPGVEIINPGVKTKERAFSKV